MVVRHFFVVDLQVDPNSLRVFLFLHANWLLEAGRPIRLEVKYIKIAGLSDNQVL